MLGFTCFLFLFYVRKNKTDFKIIDVIMNEEAGFGLCFCIILVMQKQLSTFGPLYCSGKHPCF